MSIQKEQFLKKMQEIKQDIETFKKIDFSNFDKIDQAEYSKIINTIGNLLSQSEKHSADIAQIFSKQVNSVKIVSSSKT